MGKDDVKRLRFRKELYSKIALIKSAYNFTDKAYLHLDADENYYYVYIEFKDPKQEITANDFTNEMLAQSVRHEIYLQTKNIRELMYARAMATSVVYSDNDVNIDLDYSDNSYNEEDILKDWFVKDEND